ncbi:MAG TPA: FtsX-like permease family protein [Verrucomicrobiae bacterium]|nr:FtsX-like permease family protein [Verrucomicrobiae bacterium]
MIRRRDYLRLTTQKLALRKKRAAFAIVSVALGVVVVVTVNSLMAGVRDVAVKTIWTEELDPDVIRVYTGENPYEYVITPDEQKQKAKKRLQYLTESVFDEIRGWPGVEAADRPVSVEPVSISSLDKRPRTINELQGVPEALLLRYVTDRALATGITNAIPMVVGEREVRLRFDEKRGKLEDDPDGEKTWLGREVTIVLGDNYAHLTHFNYDYGKHEYKRVADEDVTEQRDAIERNYRGMYDMTIFNTTLPLKGRVVGFCPGSKALIPFDAAVMCEKWIDQRERLAARNPPSRTEEPESYGERGRRAPKPGEYAEGIVLVKHGADVEAVAKRIEDLGFNVATRARTFQNQAEAFDSTVHIVKEVAFALGGLILALACALVWSTTSKTVSDSRVDIGLFRALGATKRDIRRLFLGEAMLQGVLGTIVGMGLGWLLAIGISHWVIGFARRSVFDPEEALLIPDSIFSIKLGFCVLLIVGAAVVSLLAGLLPANRAANIDPVKALKRE